MESPLHSVWRAIAHFLGEPIALPTVIPAPARSAGGGPGWGEVDHELLADVARVHRLEGALAEPRLTPNSPAPHVPAEIFAHWKLAHATGLAQAIQREVPLRVALQALAPTPVVVLKGAALADLVYPSPGARGMGDVDLLVPAASLPKSMATLGPLGYRRKYPGHAVLDHPTFHERQLEGPMELDLHQAFIQPARLTIDYSAVFERAVPWRALGPNAFLLAPEDAVTYSCLHAAIGEFTPTWAPAIGLLDLRLMLLRKGPLWGDIGGVLDLGAVSARAREWGVERMLYAALKLVRLLFPSVPQIQTHVSPPVRLLLDTAIVYRASPPPLVDPPRAEVVMRKALLLRPGDRLRFGLHALRRRKPR